MNNQFAVIGLGLFGSALCEELQRQDAEVLAIDIDESKTRQIAALCNHVIVADATDEATVAELGLANFDIVFVAIGDNLETSILTTLVLKEAGVKKVWVKARDKFHAKILQKVGADKVNQPRVGHGPPGRPEHAGQPAVRLSGAGPRHGADRVRDRPATERPGTGRLPPAATERFPAARHQAW